MGLIVLPIFFSRRGKSSSSDGFMPAGETRTISLCAATPSETANTRAGTSIARSRYFTPSLSLKDYELTRIAANQLAGTSLAALKTLIASGEERKSSSALAPARFFACDEKKPTMRIGGETCAG